jgi:hypothetical protein
MGEIGVSKVHISAFKLVGVPYFQSYHTPSRGDHEIQDGFLGMISIPKYYGWKSIPFQTGWVLPGAVIGLVCW